MQQTTSEREPTPWHQLTGAPGLSLGYQECTTPAERFAAIPVTAQELVMDLRRHQAQNGVAVERDRAVRRQALARALAERR